MEKRSYSSEGLAKMFQDKKINGSLRASFGVIKKKSDTKEMNDWEAKREATIRASNSSYAQQSKDNRSLGTRKPSKV